MRESRTVACIVILLLWRAMIISDTTICSVTLVSSIELLEVSFILLEASSMTFIVQATVTMIVNYYLNTFTVQATTHRDIFQIKDADLSN